MTTQDNGDGKRDAVQGTAVDAGQQSLPADVRA
jgi:hypothetical protein